MWKDSMKFSEKDIKNNQTNWQIFKALNNDIYRTLQNAEKANDRKPEHHSKRWRFMKILRH